MADSKLVTYERFVSNKDKGRGGHKIDKIFLHHMAGNLTVKQCGNVFNSRPASAHYGVNGSAVGQYVKEADTAWHCGNYGYNQRSIGIELANDGNSSNNWHVSAKTIDTAVKLIADICQRNGIDELNYTGNLNGNLCMHRWVATTACPGGYLANHFEQIAEKVNAILKDEPKPAAKKKSKAFKVKVSISDLYIRKGPGKKYETKGFVNPGTYTIVEKKGRWGKLKSGKGWICLDYAKKI